MKHTFPIAALLLVATSCSWYRDLERSLVEDDEKQAKRSQSRSRTVPREQYDQLLVKYEELSKKYEALKEGKPQSSLVDELQSTRTENFAGSAPVETETVNLLPNDPAAAPVALTSDRDVEGQLALYRRALALKTSNPGEATKIFQELEARGAPAVKVRAKFQIGELLLARQQYDLALQVFDDIISKHAHSGVVLDALKFGVICADKLGLTQKKEQYQSMLTDVFEVR